MAPGMRTLALLLASSALLSQGVKALAGPYFVAGSHLPAREQTLEEWAQEARANLTHYKATIFQSTMQVTKKIHETRVLSLKGAFTAQPVSKSARSLRHCYPDAEHPPAQAMFQLSNPVITCPPPGTLTKVGGHLATYAAGTMEDGHKFICNVDQLQPGCSVLSIGSRADTTFERAILDSTPCTIITLDCTLKAPLQTLGARHTFYPLCLGSAEQAQANPAFVTLPQLMQKIGKQRVDLLKMDIEGFEWDVLASLGTEPGSAASLPTQMAIELHVGYGGIYRNSPSFLNENDFNNLLWPLHTPNFAQLQLLMLHLADIGYGITSRDDNPLAGGCSEFAFHLVPP